MLELKDFEEAKLLAYKKFSHRTIQKIEPYFKGQFSLNKQENLQMSEKLENIEIEKFVLKFIN